MIYEKRTLKNIRYSCTRWVHIKLFYNSKFDFTAKSLVTNSVVITRVLCIWIAAANAVTRQTCINRIILKFSMVLARANVKAAAKSWSAGDQRMHLN